MGANSNVINDAGGASINIIRADPEIQIQHARVNDIESSELHDRVDIAARNIPHTTLDSAGANPLTDRKVTVRDIKAELKATKKTQSKELKELKMSSTLIKAQQVGGGILIGVGGLALVTGLVACFCGQPAGLAGVVIGMGMIVGGGMLMTAAANADKKYNPEQRANYENNVKNLKESIQLMEKYPKSETPNGRSYEEFLANFSDNPEKTNPLGDMGKLASLYKLTRLENNHEMVQKDINEVTAKLTQLDNKLRSDDLSPKERSLAEKEKIELTKKLEELKIEKTETPNPSEVAKLTRELKSHQTAARKETNANLDAADAEAADSIQIDNAESEGVHADDARVGGSPAQQQAKIEKYETRIQSLKQELATLTDSSAPAEKQLSELRSILEKKQADLSAAEAGLKEISDKDEKIKTLKEDIALIKSDLAVFEEPKDNITTGKRLTKPNAGTDFFNEHITSQKEKLAELETKLNTAEESQAANLDKKNELLATQEELTAQVNALKNDISFVEEIASRIEVAETKLSDVKAEQTTLNNLRTNLDTKKQELAGLESELTEAMNLAAPANELVEMQNQVERFAGSVPSIGREAEFREEELAAIKRRDELLGQGAGEISAEALSEINARIDKLTSEKRNLNNDIRELEDEIQSTAPPQTKRAALNPLKASQEVSSPPNTPQAARNRIVENKYTSTELKSILTEKGVANADDTSVDNKIEELRKIVKDTNKTEVERDAAKIDIVTINTARLELRKKESAVKNYLYESEADYKAEQQALDAMLDDLQNNPSVRSESKFKAEQQALDALLDDLERNPPKTGIAQNAPSNSVINENPIAVNNKKIQETEVQIKHNNEELQKKREEIRQDREHRATLKSELETMGITFPLKKEQVESKHKELTENDAKLRAELKKTDPPKTLEQIKKLEADIVESRMHITKFAELIKEYKKSHEIGVLKDENNALKKQKTALSMENMEASLKAHLDTPEIKLATMKERRSAIQKRLIELGVGAEISDPHKKVTSDNIDAAIRELQPRAGDFAHEGHNAIIEELKALKEERKQLHEQRNLIEKQLKK